MDNQNLFFVCSIWDEQLSEESGGHGYCNQKAFNV